MDDMELLRQQAAHRASLMDAALLDANAAFWRGASSMPSPVSGVLKAQARSRKTRRTGLSYRQRQARGRAARRRPQ